MYLLNFSQDFFVHRHTGGLEMNYSQLNLTGQVHRHTGGLETLSRTQLIEQLVHRHTGGLEIEIIKTLDFSKFNYYRYNWLKDFMLFWV